MQFICWCNALWWAEVLRYPCQSCARLFRGVDYSWNSCMTSCLSAFYLEGMQLMAFLLTQINALRNLFYSIYKSFMLPPISSKKMDHWDFLSHNCSRLFFLNIYWEASILFCGTQQLHSSTDASCDPPFRSHAYTGYSHCLTLLFWILRRCGVCTASHSQKINVEFQQLF